MNGPQQPTVLWEGGLYAKRGYQTFIEGDIVVTSRRHDYNNTLHGAKIVAHDIHSGDTLWTTELPVINPDIENFSQVKGVRDGQVYCTRAGGPANESVMYALDIFTEEIIWQTTAEITQSFSEDFSADSTFGIAPFTVSFTDKSVGINSTITSWEWDFDNDGITDSYDQKSIFRVSGCRELYRIFENKQRNT